MAKLKLLSGPKIINIKGHANIAPGDEVDEAVLDHIHESRHSRFVPAPDLGGKKGELIKYVDEILKFDADEVISRLTLDAKVESFKLDSLKVTDLQRLISTAFA